MRALAGQLTEGSSYVEVYKDVALALRFFVFDRSGGGIGATHAHDETILAIPGWGARSVLGAKQRSNFSHCIFGYPPN